MTENDLVLSIRAGEGEGADLDAVLARLGGLLKLYEATASAMVRPGAPRPATSALARSSLGLRFVDASPTNSLRVALTESRYDPEAPDDVSDFHVQVASQFRHTIVAAAKRDSAQIIQLFAEKSDRFRVLRAVEELAPKEGEAPLLIENAVPGAEKVVFLAEHRKWAEEAMPALTPEAGIYKGIVRKGALSERSTFSLYDGARTILLRPDRSTVKKLRDLFGQAVEIAGTATYSKIGVVKEIADITKVERYVYSTDAIVSGDRSFLLNESIIYQVDAGPDTTSFVLSNEQLNAYCYGRTLAGAIIAASADFATLWDEVAAAEEEVIHASALPIRRYLVDSVKEVVQDNGDAG